MSTAANIPLVETIGLKKYYKTRKGFLRAVDGIDLQIMQGETLGVVGESGCGKSTLGRTVIGLHAPTGGQVLFHGQDIARRSRGDRSIYTKMSMIFQDPYSSLNPRMCVADLIADPMQVNHLYNSRQERYQRVAELMDIVGLAKRVANSYPHELDGGRRQRIGIARALALNPKFVVCDEPVSALDVSIQAQILNLMQDLQDELGLTYLFITHDLSVVKYISNDILVMYLGQMVEKAPAEKLFEKPMHPYTQALLSAIPVPDPDRPMSRITMKGEITSPVNPEKGCRFAKRCPYATAACTRQDMVLTEQEPGHFVTCLRLQRGEI